MKKYIFQLSLITLMTLTSLIAPFANTQFLDNNQEIQNNETLNLALESLLSLNSNDAFKVWHKLFNKSDEYSLTSKTAVSKFQNFEVNFQQIKEHNQINSSWKLGLNKFSDLSEDEFKAGYLGFKGLNKEDLKVDQTPTLNWGNFRNFISFYTKSDKPQLDPIDWRSYCPTIHEQRCGSCWADSTATVIECNHNIKNPDNRIRISTQNIIDCSILNSGCRGGDPESALMTSGMLGLYTEEDYPTTYTPSQKCKSEELNQKGKSPKNILKGMETICMEASDGIVTCNYSTSLYQVLRNGPFATALNANALKNYRSGILDIKGCTNGVNHVVVIIGFGTDPATKQNYWIMQNSWGTTWGENGYARLLVKDEDNWNCYINKNVYRPVIN